MEILIDLDSSTHGHNYALCCVSVLQLILYIEYRVFPIMLWHASLSYNLYRQSTPPPSQRATQLKIYGGGGIHGSALYLYHESAPHP